MGRLVIEWGNSMGLKTRLALVLFASASLVAAAAVHAKPAPSKTPHEKTRAVKEKTRIAKAPSPKAKTSTVKAKPGKAVPAPTAQRAKARSGSIRVASAEPGSAGGLDPASLPLSLGDGDFLPQVLQAYRNGDLAAAEILKSKLSRPAAIAVAEWFAIRGGIDIGFERIAAFQAKFGDWPNSPLLRRRAEEALLASKPPPSRVRAYFAGEPPVSGSGRIALAFALKSDGLHAEARDLIRHVWREETFGAELESRILEEFPGLLTPSDHRFRMERLLFKENWGAAQRAAGHAGRDYPSLVKARMGVYQGGKKAESAFGAVPAELRSDSSYIFSRALFLRRKKLFAEAAAEMAKAPRDPDLLVNGDEWWSERRLIARELLDKGDAKTAYAVASHHGAEGPAQRIEAEFHAGWIALRFLNDPAEAAQHFDEAARIATSPISVARAAYWQGRAAEAAGAEADAKRYYRAAADRPITYYGQLAREKLGLPITLRAPEPLDEAARKAFEDRVPVQAVRLLQQIGELDLAITLYSDLAQTLTDPAELVALAEIAAEGGNPRAVLTIGKAGVQRGLPLDLHAYPTMGIPEFKPVGDGVEPAMVYAIARQESAFNPKAQSSAGARGLMQLMPATAKRTAQRFGLGFDLKRLTEDPAYNATIGSAHLGELMDDWKGSHVLAFASYNAGGGNVMKWVKAYGDPRKPDVDLVDWIERIPFYETRNYVQRVMENLAIYRYRFEAATRPEADRLPGSANSQY
jgi:soluble lytic murein transglycosylase